MVDQEVIHDEKNVTDDTITVTINRHFLIANSTVGETAIDLADVPVESITFNLNYGFGQYMTDGAATIVNKKDDKGEWILDDKGNKIPRPAADVAADKLAGVDARLASIYSGNYPSGGGGRSLSNHETELRAMIAPMLEQRGWNKADAKKTAMKPRNAVLAMVDRHCKANKIKVGSDEAKTLFDNNWGSINDKVKINLDARNEVEGFTL